MGERDDSGDLAEPGGKLRLFVEDGLNAGDAVALTEGQAHYLRNVMRARSGDSVRLFNGRDGEWRATLDLSGKRRAGATPRSLARPQQDGPDL